MLELPASEGHRMRTRTETHTDTWQLVEGVFFMEEAGWSVRQVVQLGDGWLVVYEREREWSE